MPFTSGGAVRAATRYGDPALREQMARKNVPGVMVTVVDYDLTGHQNVMLDLLEHTDLTCVKGCGGAHEV